MVRKNFRLNIAIRVLLITLVAVLLASVLLTQPSLFTPIALGVALIGLVLNLIYYIEKTNRELTHFLLSIRQGGFTESFTGIHRGKRFGELSGALNEVVSEFAKLNQEKELHYQFLQALNENIGVGIIGFDQDGKLLLMNPAAKKLLRNPAFHHIDDFTKVDPVLASKIHSLMPDQKIVVRANIHTEVLQLGVQLKELRMNDSPVRILLLQNLNSELEEKELEAWGQLIRVLTHEIMNSVTPIASLSAALKSILQQASHAQPDSLTTDNLEDLNSGIETIHSRSEGLLKFVAAYKQYAKPIELRIERFDVVNMIHKTVHLIQPICHSKNIRVDLKLQHKTLLTHGDSPLLEQVLINLLKNAIEAVAHDGHGRIEIALHRKQDDRIQLHVKDNGMGMDEETREKIFIPFFTTKPKGSGIGLSFSKQILKIHGGTIHCQSNFGTGSTFTLEW